MERAAESQSLDAIADAVSDEDVEEAPGQIIAMAHCARDDVTLKLGDEEWTLHKQDFGVFVVIFDFIVILLTIYFVAYLGTNQADYIE